MLKILKPLRRLVILADIFGDNKRSWSIALNAELNSLKLSDLRIDAYFRKIESIATILASLGSPLSNDDIVNIALEGLSDKYENVAGIIIHQEPFPDLKTVRSMLTTEEMQLKSRAQPNPIDSSSSSPMVLLANSGNNNARHSIGANGHETLLPNAFSAMTLQDPASRNWNMDTVTRDSSGMFLSQRKYATEILERANMVDCNSIQTPVDTESKLGDDGDPVADPTLYQSLVDHGLQLFSSSTTSLVSYSGCPTTWRSTSDAEYRGVANVFAETCWLRNLLWELHIPLSSTMLVYCNNVIVVYLSSNPVQHQRTKHIDIDIHFVRDLVAVGQICILHVPSRYQYVDIFTKGLPSSLRSFVPV
ncbi:ribonuclease H-like domain-containing protein [Tanacetum coccineum]